MSSSHHRRARIARSLVAWAASMVLIPAAQASLTSVSGFAAEMDKVLTIQPILVCNQDGSTCANQNAMYRDFLIQTYAKAGIAVAVLPWKTVNNDTYLTGIYTGDEKNWAGSPFVMPTEGASNSKKTLNAFFVNDLIDGPGAVVFGRVDSIGGSGIVIDSKAVMAFQNSDGTLGRGDTFAHEIGHNLGLEHDKLGAGGADNLMSPGSVRSVPNSTLTDEQKTTAKASQYVAGSPKLTLVQDIRTGENNNVTSLKVRFDELPEGVHLRRMTVDLPNANLSDPSPNALSRPYEYILGYGFTSDKDIDGNPATTHELDHAIVLEGATDGAVVGPKCSTQDYPGLPVTSCYGENSQVLWPNAHNSSPSSPWFLSTNGAPEIDLVFGPDGQGNFFEAGDEFTLSLLLFTHKIHEEVADNVPWPRDFNGATITLEYDFGLVTQGVFDAAEASWSSRTVTAIGEATYEVTPFGAVYAPGEARFVGGSVDIDSDPIRGGVIPEPASLPLVALTLLAACRRRRTQVRGRSS